MQVVNFGGIGASHVQKIFEFPAHSTKANCVAIGPLSGQVLATGGDDKKVNVWRLGSAASLWSLGGNSAEVDHVCFDPDEQFVVSGSRGGAIKVYDMNEGKISRSLPGHRSNITSIHYHPFGEFIVSGSVDTNVKIWDIRKKTCIQTYKGHELDITSVRFSPDGRWVASAAKNGGFKLWDLTSGKLLHSWQLPSRVHMTNLCFNPSEFILAACTTERVVRLYDMETFELMGSTTPESGAPVRQICFNPSGDVLMSATADAVRSWTWEDHVIPNQGEVDGLAGIAGFGHVKPVQAAPVVTSTTIRCLKTSDAPWGRSIAEFVPFGASGNLMAASVQGNGVSVYSGKLDQLGGSPRDPPEAMLGPPIVEDLNHPNQGGFLPLGSRVGRARGPTSVSSEADKLRVSPRKPTVNSSASKQNGEYAFDFEHRKEAGGSNEDVVEEEDDQGYQDDFETYVENAEVHMENLQDSHNNATLSTNNELPKRQFVEDEEETDLVRTLEKGTLDFRSTRKNRTGVGWSKEMVAPSSVNVEQEDMVVVSIDDNIDEDAKLAEQLSKLTAEMQAELSCQSEEKGYSEDELVSMLPGVPKFSEGQSPADAYRSTFRRTIDGSPPHRKAPSPMRSSGMKEVAGDEQVVSSSLHQDAKLQPDEDNEQMNEIRKSYVVNPVEKFGIGVMTPRDEIVANRRVNNESVAYQQLKAEAKRPSSSYKADAPKQSPREPLSGRATPREPLSGRATPREPLSGRATPREPLSARGTALGEPLSARGGISRESEVDSLAGEPVRNVDVGDIGSTLLAKTKPLMNPLSLSSSYVETPVRAAPPPPIADSSPQNHEHFGLAPQHQSTADGNSPSEDEVIGLLLNGKTDLCSALSHRTAHLKVLGAMWKGGDTLGAISHLQQLSSLAGGSSGGRTERFLQRGVAVDFFGRIDLFSVESLTLESISRILPLLLDLLQDPVLELPLNSRGQKCYAGGIPESNEDSSQEILVLKRSATVAVSSSFALLRMFGERIQTMRTSKHVLGVDVSRDERQERAVNCYRSFSAINDCARRIRGAHNGSQLGKLSPLLLNFVKAFDETFGVVVS